MTEVLKASAGKDEGRRVFSRGIISSTENRLKVHLMTNIQQTIQITEADESFNDFVATVENSVCDFEIAGKVINVRWA